MENTYANYLDMLMNDGEEEIAIKNKINEEEDRFNKTDGFLKHSWLMDKLYKDLQEAREKRIKAAKISRPRIKRTMPDSTLEKKLSVEHSKEFNDAVEAVSKLNDRELSMLRATIYREEIMVDDEMKLKDKDIEEIQVALVQTLIDLINEKGLKDIYSVSFHADSLQESAEYGEWCPETDSHILIEGIHRGKEETYGKSTAYPIPYRVIIGERY